MKHNKAMREFFSGETEYWKIMYYDKPPNERKFKSMELKTRRNAVLKLLDTYTAKTPASILDAGCGPGGITESILKRPHNVFCLDISMPMIIETKKMSKKYVPGGVPCSQGDIEELPFANNTFEVVICTGVFEYLESDDRATKELSRVVKPGGIVVISLPNIMRINVILDPYYYLVRLTAYFWYIIRKKRQRTVNSVIKKDIWGNTDFSDRRFFYSQLSRKFKSYDLVKVDVCAIGFGPITLWRKEILPFNWTKGINNFFNKLLNKAYFRHISVFANRWVFCFQKKEVIDVVGELNDR